MGSVPVFTMAATYLHYKTMVKDDMSGNIDVNTNPTSQNLIYVLKPELVLKYNSCFQRFLKR